MQETTQKTDFDNEWQKFLSKTETLPTETLKKDLRKLTTDYPNEFLPYFQLGVYEGIAKNYQEAIFNLEQAIDISPQAIAFKTLADFYLLAQNLKAAIKNYKMAFIYNPLDKKIKTYINKLEPNNNFFIEDDLAISTSSDCRNSKNIKIINSYKEEKHERNLPHFIKEQFSENQLQLFEKAIKSYQDCITKEGFVIEMNNGCVIAKQSEQTYFISEDNKLLMDMIDEKGAALGTADFPDIIQPCNNLLVLSSCYGGNFYHWLTWTIPRLQMILDAGYYPGSFDKILLNYGGFKFQKEILELLNIPKSKVIGTLPQGAVLKANKIVSATMPEFMKTPKIVTSSLRNIFSSYMHKNETLPKRIYLSRNKSSSRFVINEPELKDFLKAYNFTTIYAEDLTFKEQIEIFYNAEIILSQHGAGLTNTAFCNKNTKVIEIYNEKMKNYLDTSFWRISADCNLEHYLLFGTPIGEGAAANMKVNINNLKEIFNLANIN